MATTRRNNPVGVKADILRVATSEFVTNGFAGARIEQIAEQTFTTKRMIYYYFDSKEGLFDSVMDHVSSGFWQPESWTYLADLDPVSAMRTFAEDSFDDYNHNADIVRLLAIENVRASAHLAALITRQPDSERAADFITAILERGVSAGLFRADIDAIEVKMLVGSYATFRSVFRKAVDAVYGRDMLEPGRMDFSRQLAGDMLIATLTSSPLQKA